MYQRNHKAWYKHFDFILLDLLCVELSFLAAMVMRFDFSALKNLWQRGSHSAIYLKIMFIIGMVHIIMVLLTEPYSGILKRNAAEEAKKILLYNVYVFMSVILVLFAEQSSEMYSRIVVFVTPVVNCALMYVYRYFYKRYLRKYINSKQNQNNMLLVAPYGQVKSILHKFFKEEISTVKIVGIVLTDNLTEMEAAVTVEEDAKSGALRKQSMEEIRKSIGSEIRDIPIIGTLADMYEYARTNVVDEVLICMEGPSAEEIALPLIDMGITTHISVQSLVQVPRATVNKINGIPVITASVKTVTGRQLFVKRLVDIFFGLCGSIVTVLLTLIIAPMMWIADPGPIFFRQERVGKNGRTFKIWKFRSMYMDAEERKAELMAQNKMSGLMFKMDDDPRIIGYGKKFSLGKFLRESSIYELPQSFNILVGDMSVVGTRPPTVKEYEQYELHHKGRLATKPGLTGMWQVSGRSDITDFEEVVRLDKEYIDNFSLLLDLEIILKTFKVVLGKEGSV